MASPTVSQTADTASVVPPLRTGDRLTRDEFERRYEVRPDVKAELIEGVVHVSSPVSTTHHGAPHARLIGWLVHYESQTPGVEVADNATVRLDWDNVPQPDAFLRILPEFGGQSRTENGYVALAPELAAEVAASSVSIDLHDKKNAYRRNGVREYVVWRVEERAIDWFVLRGGLYEPLELSSDGLYQSEVFPGLQLDPRALVDGNLARVLERLQQGLQTDEHRQFANQMWAAGEKPES